MRRRAGRRQRRSSGRIPGLRSRSWRWTWRRFAAAGAMALSVGCHPGWAATNLQAAGPRMAGAQLRARLTTVANRALAQSAAMGALPILYAATAGRVNGCDYIGPTSWGGMRG